MKKLFIALAAAALCFAACDPEEDIKTLSANVILKVDDSSVPMPEKFNVKVTGADNVEVFNQEVAASASSVTVSGIISGVYSVSVDGSVIADGCNYLFSGALNSVAITTDGQNIELPLTVSKEAALLFKEIFYTGASGITEPGSTSPYRDDNFFEIFNNSKETIYLDGICIANCAPTTATEILTWEIPNADNYVYAISIWQFPGSGTQYPLEAGKSVVLASIPIDHTQKISGSINLTSADFEFFVENQQIYPDNQSIPNMVLKFGSFGNGADRYLPTVMGPAMILFKPDGAIDNSTFVSAKDKTDKCKEIPISWIIDGVEAVEKQANLDFKRFPATVDGGAVYMTNSVEYDPFHGILPAQNIFHHTGISFSRKYKNGTDITGGLVDTNNSSNDFVANTTPAIRRGL